MNDTTLAQQMVAAATRNVNLHKEHDMKMHSVADVGKSHVAQFILGQKDIFDWVPFLINCENIFSLILQQASGSARHFAVVEIVA